MEDPEPSIDAISNEVLTTFRAMGIKIFRGRIYFAYSAEIEKSENENFIVVSSYRIDLHGTGQGDEFFSFSYLIVEFDNLDSAANFMRELDDIVIYDLIVYEDEEIVEYQHQFYLVGANLFVVVHEHMPQYDQQENKLAKNKK